jgi:hypothetical protein
MLAWLGTGLAGAFWLLVAAANASIVLGKGTRGDHVPSLVPLVGGVAGVLAVTWLPVAVPHRMLWAVVPALLDVGALPLLIGTGWALLHERNRP